MILYIHVLYVLEQFTNVCRDSACVLAQFVYHYYHLASN